MLPLYLSSVHSEQMALAACCSDTGAVTQRANIRENKRCTPLPDAVASVVGSTPTQDIQHKPTFNSCQRDQ